MQANRFITESEPWVYVRPRIQEPAERAKLNAIIFVLSEALRIASIALQCIIPSSAKRLLDDLGVKDDRRTFEYAQFGRDLDYGRKTRVQQGITDRLLAEDTIFPPTQETSQEMEALHRDLFQAFKRRSVNKLNRMSCMLAYEAANGQKQTRDMLDLRRQEVRDKLKSQQTQTGDTLGSQLQEARDRLNPQQKQTGSSSDFPL